MFKSVLVANRGEVALRVMTTLRGMGIRSVAVFSDADVRAPHTRYADTAYWIGPAPARESYLSVTAVVDAAVRAGVDAVHPGYGFLAEKAEFAQACLEAGLVFIGPTPASIRAMGDKIQARATVEAAGVPTVPGWSEAGMTDDDLRTAAIEIEFPVLIKPAAGGGGKGMRLVHDAAGLEAAIASARRESAVAFGDDALFVERFVTLPRHIEVQILADTYGHSIHLGERECSLQRRHQKVIEEAPSPLLDADVRERICGAALEVARSVEYIGAGTVEFIVSGDRPKAFFFMEMNTRLQVEHPVTEMITGVDIVEQQIRIAAGEPLRISQGSVDFTGHAIEARIYAEDPDRGFLPTGGTPVLVSWPAGEGVRVDAGVVAGESVGTTYDPMLAKVVAWGPDRDSALSRLLAALKDTAVLGVTTNVGFLTALTDDPLVRAGTMDTGLIEREVARLVATAPATDDAVRVAALLMLRDLEIRSDARDPWSAPTGWRLDGRAACTWRLSVNGDDTPIGVSVVGSTSDACIALAGGLETSASILSVDQGVAVCIDGVTSTWTVATAGPVMWFMHNGNVTTVRLAAPTAAAYTLTTFDGQVRSPMPGTVVAVSVAIGDTVAANAPLAVVEAMKMEHQIRAPHPGVIEQVFITVGDSVAMDALLIVVKGAGGR